MLEVAGVTKSYGALRAVDDVSFSVAPGEVLALVGENGAGKSTLVKCLAGAEAPDAGTVSIDDVPAGRSPRTSIRQGISVVWQDLALCENLDVAANLFLGREPANGIGLQRSVMHATAMRIFTDLGVELPDIDRPISRLSGGQRQLVAIARATLERPRVLILDEPTAALGVLESRTIRRVIRSLQTEGVAIVLVSHQLDEVFELADRILVLRHGRALAVVDRAETHPDDVVSMMAGVDVDSTASRQLSRLHSLSEQLADADATSVLPLTVTSLSEAMSCDRLAVFLTDRTSSRLKLELSAALNLTDRLERHLRRSPIGSPTAFVHAAAGSERILLVRDLRDRPEDGIARLAREAGLGGAWAGPIVGAAGTIGVIVGFTESYAGLQPEQRQLLELFLSMAGAAVDRGRLVESLRTNVRSLEGLQGVLEVFAAEEDPGLGLDDALDAFRLGLGCEGAVFRMTDMGTTTVLVAGDEERMPSAAQMLALAAAAPASPEAGDTSGAAHGLAFEWTKGTGELVGWWDGAGPRIDVVSPVLHGAANSFRLALERGLVREARQESSNLRASRSLERNLTRRLGHELRTPLTAIQGFASTLRQPDVAWADDDRDRFIQLIEAESERLSRLVDALFDTASLEASTFLPNLDYCNLSVAVDRATHVVGSADIDVDLPESLIVWGDGDRLEQVFINLLGNALRHNPAGTRASVALMPASAPNRLAVEVLDDGRGLPPDVRDYLAGHADDMNPDRGLGIRLVRGFMRALDGTVAVSTGSAGTRIALELPTEPGDR
ncbi:MAG: ATP-binding cassette domain-containing protein [Actinomycetota bacterium]